MLDKRVYEILSSTDLDLTPFQLVAQTCLYHFIVTRGLVPPLSTPARQTSSKHGPGCCQAAPLDTYTA